jgi:hypothetical protein
MNILRVISPNNHISLSLKTPRMPHQLSVDQGSHFIESETGNKIENGCLKMLFDCQTVVFNIEVQSIYYQTYEWIVKL